MNDKTTTYMADLNYTIIGDEATIHSKGLKVSY